MTQPMAPVVVPRDGDGMASTTADRTNAVASHDEAIRSSADAKSPVSPGEPPDLLLTALVSVMSVVLAVWLLALTQSAWVLGLAVVTMLGGTLLLACVVRLELDQVERPGGPTGL